MCTQLLWVLVGWTGSHTGPQGAREVSGSSVAPRSSQGASTTTYEKESLPWKAHPQSTLGTCCGPGPVEDLGPVEEIMFRVSGGRLSHCLPPGTTGPTGSWCSELQGPRARPPHSQRLTSQGPQGTPGRGLWWDGPATPGVRTVWLPQGQQLGEQSHSGVEASFVFLLPVYRAPPEEGASFSRWKGPVPSESW